MPAIFPLPRVTDVPPRSTETDSCEFEETKFPPLASSPCFVEAAKGNFHRLDMAVHFLSSSDEQSGSEVARRYHDDHQ
jgi:hypothetical protein